MSKQKEFRCTRNKCYEVQGCAGHSSVVARQGHYVRASSPMDAAMKMFIDFPEEAFSGFTIQPKDEDGELGALLAWTIWSGLQDVGPAGRFGLPELYVQIGEHVEESAPKKLVGGLRSALPDEDKITLAAHRHRHGVSLLAYRAKRELYEEEIIEMLGEDFEEGRDDEYIDDICSTTFAEIQFIEVE
jgi:hypothetical protein